MTTNNPPIAAWAPSTALHKLESRHNNAPCILTDGPAELNDVALVQLIDYEALKAAHEEELFCLRQDRDAHFGELMRALEQVDALRAECEKLRTAMIEAKSYIDHYMYGGSSYREPTAKAIALIDAAMEGDKP